MSARFVVVPAASTRLPGDDPLEVDRDDPASPRIESASPGRGLVAVHLAAAPDGAASRIVEAAVGQRRPADGGPSVVEVVVDGWRFDLEVEDARRVALRDRATRDRDAPGPSAPTEIRAIISGRIAAIRVVAGEAVEAGDALLVIEAMKMQNELRAPRAGTIDRVAVAEGDTIDNGDLLVVFG
jgi:biotin carboxyl carrier protein